MSLSPEQTRMIGILQYLEDWDKLNRTTIFNVSDYRAGFLLFQADVQATLGLRTNIVGPEGDAHWLEVPRLNRIPPPLPAEPLASWIILHDDPEARPAHETRKKVKQKDGSEREIQFGDSLKFLFEDYVSQQWTSWAVAEIPRRKTISLYEKLFHLQHTIENAGTETPLELAWGMGMAVWEKGDHKLCHPLISQQVEILPLQGDMTMRIRPTSRQPKVEIDPYISLGIPEAANFEDYARRLLNQAEASPSPFEVESYWTVCRSATERLDTGGIFWPEKSGYIPGQIPRFGKNLITTDSWVLFARKRTTDFLVEDIHRLKKATEELGIPAGAPKYLVEEPVGEIPEPPQFTYRGLSTSGVTGSASTRELYFPKPFNSEQVEIVRRLESQPGVVVQGPPGTGKTHTIANIICHFLAQGKRVLVTSKGEAALAVIREQIPAEIRELTVNILTQEEQGKKQLEKAVSNINSKLTTLRIPSLQAEITESLQRIEQLHQRISSIDTELREWARKNTEVCPEDLGSAPVETLAREVVETQKFHTWFPDKLCSSPKSYPRISDEEITALITARRIIGKNLAYLHIELPLESQLLTSEQLSQIHTSLVKASDYATQITESGIPRIPLEDPAKKSQAENFLKELEAHVELISLYASDWEQRLRVIFREWHRKGLHINEVDTLDNLLKEGMDLASAFAPFAAISIELPESWGEERVKTAITNASKGKRPFPLLSFGCGQARSLFRAIRINGVRPRTNDEWITVSEYCRQMEKARKFTYKWNKFSSSIGAPALDFSGEAVAKLFEKMANRIREIKLLAINYDLTIRTRGQDLTPNLVSGTIDFSASTINKIREHVEIQLKRHKCESNAESLRYQINLLAAHDGDICSRMRSLLADSIGKKSISPETITEEWKSLVRKLSMLTTLSNHFSTVRDVTSRIANSGATNWASQLCTIPFAAEPDPLVPAQWRGSWQWSRKKHYLESIDGRATILRLTADRQKAEKQLQRTYEDVIGKRTWLKLVEYLRTDRAILRGFTAYTQAISGMTRSGKGKRDNKLRHAAREAMHHASRGVPCWIMPHWRVSESLPARLGDFDLVIVDEASQSDAWAIPAVVRGKKILIVGDDKQVGPQPSFTAQEQIDLIQERLRSAGVPSDICQRLDPRESLYDFGELVFSGQTIRLREHFRCAEPIIEFCNKLCYEGEIHCVRIPNATERLVPTLIDVHVRTGRRDQNRKINRPEAEAIVLEIASLVADPSFAGRSIGVVSLLGPDQAKFILDAVIEKVGEEKFLEHHIRCGDARTFQGSEADVIFISCVDDANSGAMLTPSKIDNIRRINVAVSRAKDRLYLYHSFAREDLNANDLRVRLIDHFRSPLKALPIGRGIDLCESDFERAVYTSVREKGYRVIPQVRIGNYRIDLVVEGDNGRRLAVECDGDRYHGPDRWMQDVSRQRILERAGWKFWRCWASSFARDPASCLDDLFSTLAQEGIHPGSEDELDLSNIVAFRSIGELNQSEKNKQEDEYSSATAMDPDGPNEEVSILEESSKKLFHETAHRETQKPESRLRMSKIGPTVTVGDYVRFCYLDSPEAELAIQIADQPSNSEMGIVNSNAPVARGLLGKREGEDCEITLPLGQRTARIIKIESRD